MRVLTVYSWWNGSVNMEYMYIVWGQGGVSREIRNGIRVVFTAVAPEALILM